MEKITSTFEKLVPFIKDSTVLKIWKFLNQLIFILTNLFALYSFFVLFLYDTIYYQLDSGHAFSNLNDEDFSYAIGPIIILILINISFKINKMMIKKLQE
tara:strand:+ start:173 stop:472 length:300 start_codon:yes stop_codon:yes gene_type:complete